MKLGALKFEERYFERIWGGGKLKRLLKKPVPEQQIIGEAWLIADHPACESRVAEGPLTGQTLRELMQAHAPKLLGDAAQPDRQGRFPLMLKLIDAGDVLSVQVHPDDAQAAALGEPDSGKTEMWYVLNADPGARLTAGLCPGVTSEKLRHGLMQGDVDRLMQHFPVAPGDGVFVRAGAIHAIGAGILLAEIQQNSDITYRLFDWNRMDARGKARELHVEKALAVVDYSATHGGRTAALRYTESGATHEVLTACRYFAAEKLVVDNACEVSVGEHSFHILLALDAPMSVITDAGACPLQPGEAALLPGILHSWQLTGSGAVLDYYVPNLFEDIVTPLRRHGYADAQILQLGGPDKNNDMRQVLNK